MGVVFVPGQQLPPDVAVDAQPEALKLKDGRFQLLRSVWSLADLRVPRGHLSSSTKTTASRAWRGVWLILRQKSASSWRGTGQGSGLSLGELHTAECFTSTGSA